MSARATLARGGSTVDLRRVQRLAVVDCAAAVIALTTLPWIGPMRFGSAILGINAEFTPAILAEGIASGLTLFAAGLIAWVRQGDRARRPHAGVVITPGRMLAAFLRQAAK